MRMSRLHFPDSALHRLGAGIVLMILTGCAGNPDGPSLFARGLNDPPNNTVDQFACNPTHIWSSAGPFRCKQGQIVSLWAARVVTKKSDCRPDQKACYTDALEARDILVERLKPNSRKLLPNGYIEISGAQRLNCFHAPTNSDHIKARCSIAREDGIIVGGGEDLACWVYKSGLIKFTNHTQARYSRQCSYGNFSSIR